MATPRIFISSTCYDLHDIRSNLKNFILDYGFEPVLSEFGDIFFDYDQNAQDSCLTEIKKCQMFILVIGNKYGSVYTGGKANKQIQSSVTMEEFKSALNQRIPKHILIEDYVKHDYDNYSKALEKEYLDKFSKDKIVDADIDSTKVTVRNEFDKKYHFPQESYKQLFKFLDMINELSLNNAILTFKTSDDIKAQLKKQWAGFMYDNLVNSTKKEYSKETEIDELSKKINAILGLMNNFTKDNNDTGKISLDLKKMDAISSSYELGEYQRILDDALNDIIYTEDDYGNEGLAGYILEEVTYKKVKVWLDNLENLLNMNKWSKTISFVQVFNTFMVDDRHFNSSSDFNSLMQIFSIYSSLDEKEKTPYINCVMIKLKLIEKAAVYQPFTANDEEDEIPF